MYLSISDIRHLDIELTSRCNAGCPQCGRTDNEYLPLDHITLEQITTWLSPEVVSQLDLLSFAGNYGDAIVNPDCLEIVKYFKENGCKKIILLTNGGVRDVDFWRELGKLGIVVVFAIDGLEDTNHIYRVGVRWERLMENVNAFISSGGIAKWAYLLFQHNEHQVDEARELCKEMGFQDFTVKASSRFVANETDRVRNKKNQEIVASVQSKKFSDKRSELTREYGTWENYIQTTPVSCVAQRNKSIYIDFAGTVWPCCWMAAVHQSSKTLRNARYHTALINSTMHSLRHHTLEDIISGPWFSYTLERSWTNPNTRMQVCGIFCGEKYSPRGNADEVIQ